MSAVRSQSRELPKLLVIADRFSSAAVRDITLDLVNKGLISWLQLRDHGLNSDQLALHVRRIVADIRSRSEDIIIALNGHPDLAAELNLGIHLGFRGPPPAAVRRRVGADAVIGFSAHGSADIARVADDVDYVTLSPVYQPTSKRGIEGRGLDLIRSATGRATGTASGTVSESATGAVTQIPIYALGGISPGRVRSCLRAGAYGVAVVGGIFSANDPLGAVRTYVQELK